MQHLEGNSVDRFYAQHNCGKERLGFGKFVVLVGKRNSHSQYSYIGSIAKPSLCLTKNCDLGLFLKLEVKVSQRSLRILLRFELQAQNKWWEHTQMDPQHTHTHTSLSFKIISSLQKSDQNSF